MTDTACLKKVLIEDLALFGGPPCFKERVHVGRPNLIAREQLLGRINDILDRQRLTNNGPEVKALESAIAQYVGVKNCIAVCNGTAGLEIAVRALGLAGEVIVPAFTFIATAHVLQWLGIRPVFCDIDPKTHNVDPRQIEKLMTDQTTGIIGVHLWGRPCEIETLESLADKHHLKLLFDAAHAFGCSYKNKMIGNFGHAEVFSFHATKFFHTLEGGAVLTNDDVLAQKLRLMRNFGFQGYDNVVSLGINAKMNEISAAVGMTLFEHRDDLFRVNRQNYQQYETLLADIPGVRLTAYDESQKSNYQYIVIEIDEKKTGLHRDQFFEILDAENIAVRRYFYPGCHQAEPYRSRAMGPNHALPQTDALAANVLCLPNGNSVTAQDIRRICHLIKFIMAQGPALKNLLSKRKGE